MKKIDGKLLWKTKKKQILLAVIIVAALALGCGAWYYAGHNSSEPVYVYPFQYIGMTEYWGDSQESHGPVTTDKIQTVFLSDTQEVIDILVQEGDTVKKGDLLMTFDTTLSDLQLERKRLDVEKKKLQLEDAQAELRRINSMKPMSIPSNTNDNVTDAYLGRGIRAEYEISDNKDYDGSSAQKAIICWIHSNKEIDDGVFLDIQDRVSYYQYLNTPKEEPVVPPDGDDTTTGGDGTTTGGDGAPTGGTDTTAESGLQQAQEPSSASQFSYPIVSSFHVVFKVTSGNMSLGEKVIWQGVKATDTGNHFTFRFENAVIPDHMLVDMGGGEASADTPQIDFGSGYTAAQIAQMRSDQQKKIKDLEFQIKMAEAEYKIMQTEVDDGNVYAQIDGKVISCLTEEEAKKTRQPVLKVSGGGGFYVEGFVSELEKHNMKPGQEVTINDWNSGMTYTGTIQSVGDFPTREGYFSGNGNPNASFYPFQVFVEEDADLQEGSYVSVVYSAAESENGIYLENPFLRTEKGKSYVLVLGPDGKLEQRFVTTGKSLWGNYTQILSNLTADDLIAFPYGKNVKPGVAAIEGDMSNLYG
ncbi:MAG: HlyD family efflux transporter periplasmic adaptor subunit [Oscillospiraceae bacterium]|nr:HlyD family efflux transporter periplasmic adaptor subunit [Oscillospiraceae bacterium]